ncbi:glycosyltransferase family 2 protein [Halovivax cerinus]|uniref:Glycosyltransferase family 2 protein n=1 Tax=Halovivax cerinus TaxID=1487865 RepID=A0ABD5NTL1_9EURY|nr:glycosyltransferase family 2 protein [Halovivax cerinus]
MYEGQTVGVVIPAYNEAGFVGEVIETLPEIVDRAYVVDDRSTDDTWSEIEAAAMRVNAAAGVDGTVDAMGEASDGVPRGRVQGGDQVESTSEVATDSSLHADGGELVTPRIVTVRHSRNRGVGGAIKTGYALARENGLDVVAVMNGDGQMDPSLLQRIVDPVVRGRAAYAKGNRLASADDRAGMPPWRLFGNAVLTYITKLVSGYWGMSDPQNGYTAISRDALEAIELDRLYEGYGFCNDVLVHLNVEGFRVEDVPMPARYGDEQSHIRYSRFVPSLSWLLLRRGLWRYRMQSVGSGPRQPYLLLLAGVLGGTVGLAALGVAALTVGVGSAEAALSLLAVLLGGLFVAVAVTVDRLHGRSPDTDGYEPAGGD